MEAGTRDGSATPAPLGPLVEMLPQLPADVVPPEATRQQVFARLVAALREPRRREPYLLVIEDAHCADEATGVLIRHLARRVHGCRALVCLSHIDPKTRRQGIGCASCPGTPLRRLTADGSTFAHFRAARQTLAQQHARSNPDAARNVLASDHRLRARLVLAAQRM